MALGTTNISTSLVAQTIGANSNDVGTLCKSTQINMLSVSKPIKYASVAIPLDGTYGWASKIPQQGQINQTTYDGIYYGIKKPFKSLEYISNKIGEAPIYVPIYPYYITDTWSYVQPSGGEYEPFRLGDFRLYEHEKKTYPQSHSKFPILAYPHAIRSTGNSISISCTFIYHKDEFNGLLGLGQLFDVSTHGDGKAYFGVVARALNKDSAGNNVSNRYNIVGMQPCSVGYYSTKAIGDYDANTNSYNMCNISFSIELDTTVLTSGTTTENRNKFHIDEWIEVIPVIATYDVPSVVNIHSIQQPLASLQTFIYKIPSAPLSAKNVDITNISATLRRTVAPAGYSADYSLIWLDTLSLSITKSIDCDSIIFDGDLTLSPTSAVDMPLLVDGDLGTSVSLATGVTTATLNQSIITNYGSGVHNPQLIIKIPSTNSYNLTLGLIFLKNGWERTIKNVQVTVGAGNI